MVSTALIVTGYYTCHCPEAPRMVSAAIVPIHHMIFPLGITFHAPICITCCPTPSHVLSKARHQVPWPKRYMSLHQGITCHCPKGQATDGRYQLQLPHGNKSNSPTFRHYMSLPHGIGCNCPKALHAKASPIIIVPSITCHYPMA